MDIVANTHYESGGTKCWIIDVVPRLEAQGHQVVRNDWDNYKKYDVALFMAPDSEVRKAQEQNPGITTVLMDPKLDLDLEDVKAADLLVVSSIEQKDAFIKYNNDIYIYPPFPDYDYEVDKDHLEKDTIVIGYHGNKFHLNHFADRITRALEKLGTLYDIRLIAIYNLEQEGRWEMGVPRNVPVEHIDWTPECYKNHLAKSDIGLVNYFLPINEFAAKYLTQYPSLEYLSSMNNRLGSRFGQFINKKYQYKATDYVNRYKYSSNPGRIYPFSQLGIPVVADFTPSNSRLVDHGRSGFLAKSTEAWQYYLEKLINSPELRQEFSENLRQDIEKNFSVQGYFDGFVKSVEELN